MIDLATKINPPKDTRVTLNLRVDPATPRILAALQKELNLSTPTAALEAVLHAFWFGQSIGGQRGHSTFPTAEAA